MKKLLSLATLIGAFALLPAGPAAAHDSCRDGRVVGYTPCGKPIIAYHEVVARDHCGRNIWEWVTHYPSSCHCRDHYRERCDSRHSSWRDRGWGFSFRF